MTTAGQPDVAARIAELARELADNERLLSGVREGLRVSREAWNYRAERAAATDAENSRKALERTRKAIEANAQEARSSATAVIATAVGQSAPGYLSAPWTDAIWSNQSVGSRGEWLRVGSMGSTDEAQAIVLPLSAGSWSVVNAGAEVFRDLVHNCLIRLLSAFDPVRVQTIIFDPELSLDLAVFSAVRTLSPASVPPAITSTEELDRALEGLLREIGEIDDRLTSAGQETYWKALASGHALSAATPLRLLILGRAPGLSERGADRFAQVKRLAAERGVLVLESVSTPPDAGTVLDLARDTASANSLPGITWKMDSPAGAEFIRAVCARIVARPRQSLSPSVSFEDVIARIDDAWIADADDGLEAVIGTSDFGDLTVRLRGENPPMPNALVGGSTGQGKSNLLLVLIHALATRYSPSELEMVLVDLKDGVEFASLGPTQNKQSWLPHVRALGLELDPDYSIAVLEWITQQISERSELFKSAGTNSFAGYRASTGRALPRLLVVVDEFQKLFEGDDDQVSKVAAVMEDVARRGRSFGVHVVLASQAVSGIRGLAMKQEAIFGQFDNRISLRNTASESQAFLSSQNFAAAELKHRGQVVLNESKGLSEGNRLGTVAFADNVFLERLQTQLFLQGHRDRPPSIFRASAFADWPAGEADSRTSSGPAVAVGLPIRMEPLPREITLGRAPNQGLAIVGASRRLAVPVLVRAAATAARSLGQSARVTILDGDSSGPSPARWLGSLRDNLASAGNTVEYVEAQSIAARLAELAATPGTTDLVIAIALDSVDLNTPAGPEYHIASDSLRELLKNGSLHHTWVIGWWQSLAVLEEQAGYHAPGIRAWVFCSVSKDDLASIAGHSVRQPTGDPRVTFFDRNGQVDAERLVPFDPSDVIGDATFA